MPKPRAGLILEPFRGSERGFVFSTTEPVGAYVLDSWSFTLLEALKSLPEDQVRQTLLKAGDANDHNLITANFTATVAHLRSLGLLEA